ncbi:MAG: S1 RNA-binding domain-containing protein [Acidobacteriaceae bacterium]|nr:S1 RNA-binding domain-containing protein [Acidobacteriaceae bacterium]
MAKRISAVALYDRVGEVFTAIVTGVNDRGVFVRTSNPPVDGRLMVGDQSVDVGDWLKVRLIRTDPRQGYIDFARV